MNKNFDKINLDTTATNIIYVMRFPDSEKHAKLLKIGKTSAYNIALDTKNNDEILNKLAKKRIDEYTKTSGIKYEILHTEIAINYKDDKEIHKILQNSGIKQIRLENSREWFECSFDQALEAINAAKKGYKSFNNTNSIEHKKITLRSEQKDAINRAKNYFLNKNKTNSYFLWNAKMRFGKTICTLQLIKEIEIFKKVLIITHRPVLNESWENEFNLVFENKNKYGFFNKKTFSNKAWEEKNTKIYFASIQDLRGSKSVEGKHQKNKFIFEEKWDFLVVDEAHEGTLTDKGKKLINTFQEKSPSLKILYLSGTPFNLLEVNNFNDDQIFAWDYVSEQKMKKEWYKKNFGDHNPYEELPSMQILTIDLSEALKLENKFQEKNDITFNFKEFFRTWTGNIEKDGNEKINENKIGTFVHEKEIIKFLYHISSPNDVHKFPLMNHLKHYIY